MVPNPASNGQASLVVETTYAVPNMPVAIYDMKGSLLMKMSESKAAGRLIIERSADWQKAHTSSKFTTIKKLLALHHC